MEKSVKILICDENAEERKKIAETIVKAGIRRPDECADGESALELSKKLTYDVVITDLWMPRLDGIGIIRAMKPIYTSCRFILISPISKESVLLEATEAGADLCLLKPFGEASLLSHL